MIDHSAYDTAPVTDLAGAISLVDILVKTITDNHPDALVDHRAYMAEKSQDAQDAIVAQQKAAHESAGAANQAVDLSADRSFSALLQRLRAALLLPPDHAHPALAEKIIDRVFGSDGLEFLRLPYASQLTQMRVRMVPVDGDAEGKGKEAGLAENIDAVAGPAYLANVRHQITRYDAMVHSKSTTAIVSESLLPHLHTLRTAITHFATIVIGTIRLGKPETLAAAQLLLAPIDNARAASSAAVKPKKAAAEAPTPTAGPAVIVSPPGGLLPAPGLATPSAVEGATPASPPAVAKDDKVTGEN